MSQNVSRNIAFKPDAGINSVPVLEVVRVPAEGKRTIQDTPNRLTRREQEVLALIAERCTTKEIAARLKISFKTAVCHRSHLMAKTGSRNSVTLVLYAVRQGLIDP